MNNPKSSARHKKSPSIIPVKTYETHIGEKIKLAMFRRGDHYGIASFVSNAAVALDYKNCAFTELRTLPDNVAAIIDWVPLPLANQRYLAQLTALMRPTNPATSPRKTSGKPHLWVVSKETMGSTT